MRSLVVDGLNVIGSRPDGWWRDRRAAMRALTESLAEHARGTGDEVTVVFDGRPFELPDVPVRVIFAPGPGPGAADDAIVSELRAMRAALESDADLAGVEVVTSDAGLAGRVRALGARVVSAGGFRRHLDSLANG